MSDFLSVCPSVCPSVMQLLRDRLGQGHQTSHGIADSPGDGLGRKKNSIFFLKISEKSPFKVKNKKRPQSGQKAVCGFVVFHNCFRYTYWLQLLLKQFSDQTYFFYQFFQKRDSENSNIGGKRKKTVLALLKSNFRVGRASQLFQVYIVATTFVKTVF